MQNKKTNKYEDIIHLPHHQSTKRKHMSMHDRAAQFSPFDALTGYDEAIQETARLTDSEIELEENELDILNAKLQIILEHIHEHPLITITYFEKDEKKSGGAYLTLTDNIKKIDDVDHVLFFQNGERVHLEQIVDIQCQLLKDINF